MTLIAPRLSDAVQHLVAGPGKTMPANPTSTFVQYLSDAVSASRTDDQAAWSFNELGIFGHGARQGSEPARDIAARVSRMEPLSELAQAEREPLRQASAVLQPSVTEFIVSGSGVAAIAAIAQTDETLGHLTFVQGEIVPDIVADMPATGSAESLADEAQKGWGEHGNLLLQARGPTSNSSDIGLAVSGTGKFLEVHAFGARLDPDTRTRLRKAIDITLEQYGHAAASFHVNGSLQDRSFEGTFIRIIEGGTDGNYGS